VPPAPSTEDQYIGRVDWIVSSKHNFFGRYFVANYQAPPQFGGNALYTTNTGLNDRNTSIVLGDTYSFSPTVLNSAHVTFSRLAVTRGPASDFISGTALGINMHSYFPNELVLSVSGKFSVGCSSCSPSWFNTNSGQIADDVDIIHGRHHIAFGADVIRNQLNNQSGHLGDGIITINGQFSNDALLDFMLGLTSQFRQGAPDWGDEREQYLGLYALDNVQVAKRVNLQVGLRWEPYFPIHAKRSVGATWFSPSALPGGNQEPGVCERSSRHVLRGRSGISKGSLQLQKTRNL
jgi:hypothetical protein